MSRFCFEIFNVNNRTNIYSISDILNTIKGISNKMLSKELKKMEINKLINRAIVTTQPISVEYELTEHGRSLQIIIENLTDWGFKHRQKIIEH